jgi:hypothetical protein
VESFPARFDIFHSFYFLKSTATKQAEHLDCNIEKSVQNYFIITKINNNGPEWAVNKPALLAPVGDVPDSLQDGVGRLDGGVDSPVGLVHLVSYQVLRLLHCRSQPGQNNLI